jgi:hypothetical protein
MNSLELKSVVRRLHDGECPKCFNKLSYVSGMMHFGKLEKNGMPDVCNTVKENHVVFCDICGYSSEAEQIGLKLVPVDRIVEFDENWDVPYLEENTLIYGEKGKNPFDIKDKE